MKTYATESLDHAIRIMNALETLDKNYTFQRTKVPTEIWTADHGLPVVQEVPVQYFITEIGNE